MRPLSRLAALSVLLLNACYPPGDGKPPPLDEIYFPTGAALDGLSLNDQGAPRYLYIANSDFDLQYRSSSVISYDLDALRKVVPRSCNKKADCPDSQVCDAPEGEGLPSGLDKDRNPSYYCVDPDPVAGELPVCGSGNYDESSDADRVLYPGRCKPIDPTTLMVDSVGIGAFASDMLWHKNCQNQPGDKECVPDASAPSRLFIPVRGDSTLHWIDVDDNGHFHCGQDSNGDHRCDDAHRSGDTPDDNVDHLRQNPEPFALDATADGKFIVITNQTTGTVSLYHNDSAADAGPKLVNIAGGLPIAPIGVAAIPQPTFADPAGSDAQNYAPGFLVTYRNAAEIDLLRVHESEPFDPMTGALPYTRFTLRRAGVVPINANSLNFDQRGIAIDDSARLADYEKCKKAQDECGTSSDCAASYATCLRYAHQPSVFAASRAPASVLVGALTTDLNYVSGTSEVPSFWDSVSLSVGPSRVIAGSVRVPGTTYTDEFGGSFDLESRLFIVCFDSRRIFVYDPKRNAIEGIVSTGRGPHALAVDGRRGLAYLSHFTDSYLGVISLDQRFPKTYAAIVASVGTPKAPRSSK